MGALVVAGVAPYRGAGLNFLEGMGQDNVEEFGPALAGEEPLRDYLDALRPALIQVTPEGMVREMSTLLPDVDRAVLTAEFGEDLAASFREALRISVDGWLDDDLAYVRPWGFDLAEIQVPVALWQGDADLMVPFAHGEWLAEHVPAAAVHLEPGEGHLSLAIGGLDRMRDELLELTR